MLCTPLFVLPSMCHSVSVTVHVSPLSPVSVDGLSLVYVGTKMN